MEEQQYSGSFKEQSSSLLEHANQQQPSPPSEFHSKYIKEMEDAFQDISQREVIDMLSRNGIRFHFSQQSKRNNQSYNCQICLRSNNQEAIIYNVTALWFSLKVSLANLKGKNPFLRHVLSKKGHYGMVYYFSFLNQKVAFKIFPLAHPDIRQNLIMKAVKEYAIMKICSSLECGPLICPVLGFDVAAFDDSVMFCMEQCTQIKKMDHETINCLKTSLGKMHRLHIVHFDINPNNIMFSHSCKKPVFIDYGFSEVVKQSAGQKTLITFRGTPAFCSQQMVNLLGKEDSSFIDAYFNDLTCLKTSIASMKQSLRLVADEDIHKENQTLQDQSIQNSLFLILLKYKFFLGRKQGIVSVLKQNEYVLLRKCGSEVLKIFDNNILLSLFDDIYGQMNKEFHRYVDPNDLQSSIKWHKKTFSSLSIMLNTSDSIIEDYSNHEITAIPSQPINYQKYYQYLSIQNIFSNSRDEEHSRHILIEFLRFDCSRSSLYDRITLSNNFNKLYGVISDRNIDSLKTTFKILMEYCLEKPYTVWKKQHIFIILTQAMMLDMNMETYSQKLFEFMQVMFVTFQDQVKRSLELFKFGYLTSFKHIYQHQYMKEQFNSEIWQYSKRWLTDILQSHSDSNDEQIKSLVLAFAENMNPQQTPHGFYNRIEQILYPLKDDNFKREITEFLLLESIQTIEQKHTSVFVNLNKMKDFVFYQIYQTKKEFFHYSLYYIARVLRIIKKKKQTEQIYMNLIKLINCQEISSKFRFQMWVYLIDQQIDTEKTRRFVLELLENNNQLSAKLSAQYAEMMPKIRNDTALLQKYPQIIDRLFESFLNLRNKQITLEVLTAYQAQYILYQYCFLQFFTAISPKFQQSLFFTNLINKYHRLMELNRHTSIEKRLYYQFRLEIYINIFYHSKKQYEDEFLSLQALYKISKLKENQKLEAQFLMGLIKNSMRVGNKERLTKYVYQFYQLSNIIDSFDRYFQTTNRSFIEMNLAIFERNNDRSTFYNCLIDLSKFVTKYCDETHYQQWFANIDALMRRQPCLRLMKYSELSSHINQNFGNNHYFIIYFIFSLKIEESSNTKRLILKHIFENIDFLASYAKETIMYCSAKDIINYYSGNERKKTRLATIFGYRYLKKKQFLEAMNMVLAKLKKKGSYDIKVKQLKKKMKVPFSV